MLLLSAVWQHLGLRLTGQIGQTQQLGLTPCESKLVPFPGGLGPANRLNWTYIRLSEPAFPFLGPGVGVDRV